MPRFVEERKSVMIEFNFYGTSHGKGYGGVIKGLPQGFTFSVDFVNKQLQYRKEGLGRSARQAYPDAVTFKGFTDSVTVNGDLEFFVPNAKQEDRNEITAVRSGHVDLVGKARYADKTVRELNELYSARSSVCYVVLGAICKQYLQQKGIYTYHYVHKIGGITSRNRYRFGVSEKEEHFSLFHCSCKYATNLMQKRVDEAKTDFNSLGGLVVVGATGVPMGVGQALPYAERLDAVISANLMGIPSVKGVSFGIGDKYADLTGADCYDKLTVKGGRIQYATNNCGGIVAGITTGQDITCKLTVKPVPTVKGAKTVDTVTLAEADSHYERADTCVVVNVGVIADNILAYVLLNQLIKQGAVK